MLTSDKSNEPQFFVENCVVVTHKDERKLKRFPAEEILDVFLLLVLCGSPHRRYFTTENLTGHFNSEVIPTRQWGINPAREFGAGFNWSSTKLPEATDSAVLITDVVWNSLCLYHPPRFIVDEDCKGVQPLSSRTIRIPNQSSGV